LSLGPRHPAGVPAAPGRAVVLAAGAGSRLSGIAPVKPLVPVGGRPLLLRVLDSLAAVGVGEAVVVTGHAEAAVRAALAEAPLRLRFVHNPDWETGANGRSLAAAARHVAPDTLLVMGDHLVAPPILAALLAAEPAPLLLAVDRRLGHPWVDEADVTRVRTWGGGRGSGRAGHPGGGAAPRPIAAIGKGLLVYDGYDTGCFRIGPELVDEVLACPAISLSEAVAALAARGLAFAVDAPAAAWLDVDDARALALAEAACA